MIISGSDGDAYNNIDVSDDSCGRTISPVYENDGLLPYFVWKNGNVSYDSWNTDDKSGSYGSKIYTNLD